MGIKRNYQQLDKMPEAKVLIVGDSRTGKTSLFKKLVNGEDDPPMRGKSNYKISKHSLTLSNEKEAVIAHLWDFDSDIISNSLHEIFYCPKTIYIIVDTADRDTNYENICLSIKNHSNNPIIIVVQNIISGRIKDIHINHEIKRQFQINLSLKYQEDKTSLKALKDLICSQIIQLNNQINSTHEYDSILEKVQIEKKNKDHIKFETFKTICCKNNLQNNEKILKLSKCLHNIGVFLHFQKNSLLKRILFLKEEALIKAISMLLENNQNKGDKGFIIEEEINDIYKNTNYEDIVPELIALMISINLIFELRNKGNYFIPRHSKNEEPEYDWNDNNDIFIHYKYPSPIPRSLIYRIIKESQYSIKDYKYIWEKGIILKKENTEALIKINTKEDRLEVKIKGEKPIPLISIIDNDLYKIHEDLKLSKVERQIPCNCNQCQQSLNPYHYNYDSLKRRIKKGKHTVWCGNIEDEINIRNFPEHSLIGILTENIIKTEPKTMKNNSKELKFFISYSKENKEQLDKFNKYLGQFKNHYKFKPFYDGDLKCGDEWDPTIKKHLNEADLIICLVSQDFLSTEYIKDTEIKTAMKRHYEGKTTILPVILTDCYWKSKINPLNKIACFPEKGEAIYRTGNINDIEKGWTSVLEQIEKFLEENTEGCPQ